MPFIKVSLSRKCEECNLTFKYPSILQRHIKNNHSLKHACQKCPDRFNNMHQLRSHVSINHPKLECPVDGCSYSTNKNQSFKNHIDRMHGENSVLCTVTGCGFTTSYIRLRRHMIEMHSDLTNGISSRGSSPQDSEDGLSEVEEDTTMSSVHLEHSIRQLKCSKCEKRFVTQQQLQRHDKNVHLKIYKTYKRERKYKCDECPKNFTTPGLLADHVAVHKGETPYECQRCVKKFSARARFAVHLSKYHAISIKDLANAVAL
ncbi:Zinc finger domain containing protein [Aphelenchoides besseyi]|nr:Zinc finger domain containing protein [Aphelenchoides besseyi]KAI6193943.1 Zinc finger domain containing protein [Aphelenchoides besseyi]